MGRERELKAEPLVVCDKCGFIKYMTGDCNTCIALNEKDKD
jgi:hypothetical protein